MSKSFGAVAAVRNVSFDLYGGEAHALVGENGAGKSTIVKMLAGVHRPDTGTIELDGTPVELTRPGRRQGGRHRGDLPGADALPRPVGRGEHRDGPPAAGPVRHASTVRRCTRRPSSSSPGSASPIDPTRPARGLSIADQQLVEIAKALSADARVVVMDEPTAALTGVEVERLFAVARSLRDDGAALLFISHRFEEITALCERVTIMRDGKHVSTDLIAELTVDEMVRRMVGRDLGALFPKQDVEPGDVVLEVDGLSRDRRLRATSPSRSAPARSSRWPGWSAPAAPRWCSRSSASTRATPARSRSRGKTLQARLAHARRWPPASRWSPRTAASRAW